MTTFQIPYHRPERMLDLKTISIEQLRVDLSERIHCLRNRSSSDAFIDNTLIYFGPGLLLNVAVKAMPDLDCGNAPEFTRNRQQVIASVVAKMKASGAVEEGLLRSADHYCAKFRLYLGRGASAPIFRDLWLVPVRPWFFWSQTHDGVADPATVVNRRRLTGLATLQWVTPLNEKGKSI